MNTINASPVGDRPRINAAGIIAGVALLSAFSIHTCADEQGFSRINAQGDIATAANARCIIDRKHSLTWLLSSTDMSEQIRVRWGGTGAEKNGDIFFDDWNALLTQANDDVVCGFTDWRVPTVAELKTLLQEPGSDTPWIDTAFFPDTLPEAYWTISTYSNYPEHAKTVHFGNGNSYYYHGYRGNPSPVRLVRSVPVE